ncbi:putative retrovirus-related pol polyprotein from transposon opus [Trichonephila clavipes]|nr:putative retrovirus-related pol polyprotein from transposon opus [Trichonephila clavipes]
MVLEVQKLLQEGVIEPSNSPWRAQAFVIRGENHKPRMVVDYSQTINKYTLLDAYPFPKIEESISRLGIQIIMLVKNEITPAGASEKSDELCRMCRGR